MDNLYQQKVAGMNRFNDWEVKYEAQRSHEDQFYQFLQLYDLGLRLPAERIRVFQKEHLDALIQIQRDLRKCDVRGQ